MAFWRISRRCLSINDCVLMMPSPACLQTKQGIELRNAVLLLFLIHGLSVFIVIILFIIAAVNSGADHSGSYSWHASMIINLFVGLFSLLQLCLRVCVQRSLAAAGKESYEMVTTRNPSITIGSTGRAGDKSRFAAHRDGGRMVTRCPHRQ